MELNIVVFSYNRYAGLESILSLALNDMKLISRIILVCNGEFPGRKLMEKFHSDTEVIILGKRGDFDSSVIAMYDIIKNWSGYTFMCGDDDLPNFAVLHEVINSFISAENLPSVIGFRPPMPSCLFFETEESKTEILNRLVNKNSTYEDMLLYFTFSLPLGSFLISNADIKYCSREILIKSIGTWHTYSILAFEISHNKQIELKYNLPYLWLNLNIPVLLQSNQLWDKTYKLDYSMKSSLTRALDFLHLDVLNCERKTLFTQIYMREINNWIPEEV